MKRKFRDGDVIIVNPHAKPDHDDYIVVSDGKEGATQILHPLNPKYPAIELSDKHQYRIIGKVVEKKRY